MWRRCFRHIPLRWNGMWNEQTELRECSAQPTAAPDNTPPKQTVNYGDETHSQFFFLLAAAHVGFFHNSKTQQFILNLWKPRRVKSIVLPYFKLYTAIVWCMVLPDDDCSMLTFCRSTLFTIFTSINNTLLHFARTQMKCHSHLGIIHIAFTVHPQSAVNSLIVKTDSFALSDQSRNEIFFSIFRHRTIFRCMVSGQVVGNDFVKVAPKRNGMNWREVNYS